MTSSIFGWSYPPGCSGTPYDEEYPDNTILAEAFADYDGPGNLYRTYYKYTDCGPTT